MGRIVEAVDKRPISPHKKIVEIIDDPIGTSQLQFPYSDAAQGFGISVRHLRELAAFSRTLAVQPDAKNDVVVVKLIDSVSDLKRNLWDEMLGTLKEGRTTHSQKKAGYTWVYDLIHYFDEVGDGLLSEYIQPPKYIADIHSFNEVWKSVQAGQRPEEEDIHILTAYAWALFGQLEIGTQSELGVSRNPQTIRTSRMAFAGSS